MCSKSQLPCDVIEKLSQNFSETSSWGNSIPDGIEQSSNTIVMGGYNAYATYVSTSQPEIITAIQQLNVETEIITKAIEIFYQITSMKINDNRGNSVEISRKNKSVKGSKKIRLIFYCIFMAYNELGCPVDPAYAADIVLLPRKEIEQALGEYAPSGATLIDPEKMVLFYIRGINNIIASSGITYNIDVINRDVQQIIQTCKSSRAGKEWVQNTAAKLVAISALYFYMNDIKGFDIARNIPIFEQAFYLSWACIRRYHDQISKYYNYDSNDHRNTIKPTINLSFLS